MFLFLKVSFSPLFSYNRIFMSFHVIFTSSVWNLYRLYDTWKHYTLLNWTFMFHFCMLFYYWVLFSMHSMLLAKFFWSVSYVPLIITIKTSFFHSVSGAESRCLFWDYINSCFSFWENKQSVKKSSKTAAVHVFKKIGLYLTASPWIFTSFLKVLTLCLRLEEKTEYHMNHSKIIEIDTIVEQKCWEAWS